MKIASFNISGGFYMEDDTVDFFDKSKSNNIDNKLLNDIIKTINDEQIDIACFQEIIVSGLDYINQITNTTNLKYESHFELSPNHLVESTKSGIAILSRFKIDESITDKFTNPMLSKKTSSGNTYYTFDKGYIITSICANNNQIDILTHHGFPYRRFNSTPEENANIFEEFDEIIKKYKPDIITGDFNSEHFIDMMNYTRENYKKTINAVTTTDGMRFDEILVKNDVQFNSKIVKSLSDHYMILCEITI